MSTIGTFDGFTAARLGIYAAQQGLSVTGNNISNINTTGYTRQVLDQISLKTGAYDRYRSQFDNHIGTGTLVRSINQIRDPYLDVRFRNTSADVGYSDAMLSGLDQIATILDEVGRGIDGNLGDGMLYAQIKKMQEALRELQKNPTSDNDTLVRQAADALVSLFNTYAGKLETLKENTEKKLNQEVTDVNKILRNIRELNEDIREAELHGDGALELRDERNRQIDELSSKLPISAVYTMEDIGGGKQIEKLSIYLNNANPDPSVHTDESMLVDGVYATQINIPEKLPLENPNWGKETPADPANPGDYDPNFPTGEYRYYMTKADGTIVGTNDPALADQSDKDNSNYLITIGKLLDSEGREWEKPTTEMSNAKFDPPGTAAIYESQVTLTGGPLAAGSVITVGEKKYTLDAEITDAAAFANFIAKKLSSSDYNITANGDKLIYTAKPNKVGAVGTLNVGTDGKLTNLGPDAIPAVPGAISVDQKDANGAVTGTVNITFGAAQETTKGEDPNVPASSESTDPYGTVTSISYSRDSNGQWYEIKTITEHARAVMLDDNDLNGSIQAIRELLTEDGEFTTTDTLANVDENATTKRGIPYYQHSLDLLAQQFAKALNDLNKGYMVDQNGNYLDKDGNILQLEGTDAIKHPVNQETGLTPEQAENLINNNFFKTDSFGKPILVDGKKVADLNKWLDAEAAKGNLKIADGAGVLFSNRNDNNDPTGITASNISISKSWLNREFKVVPTNIELFGHEVENTTKNENIGHIITILDAKLTYDPNDLNAIVDSVKNGGAEAAGDNIFIGSFNDMFSNMCTVLGNDQRSTNVELTSDYNSLLQIDTNRDGVSGVDLNDEAMNMMQYQKAYTAACRLMTAVDEALDRLINNTGIAGR